MQTIPLALYEPQGDTTFDLARIALHSRPRLRVSVWDLDWAQVREGHIEEDSDVCASCGDAVADPEDWNHATDDYPITAVEFNWKDGDEWKRAYSNFEDGTHRIKRALELQRAEVWLAPSEYRFSPAGLRPQDREHVRSASAI